MDINDLVDKSVKVTAEVEKIVRSNHSNDEMILLKDVHINDTFFRNHAWVKMTKRLSVLVTGDKFTANATVMKYYDLETNREEKLGLRSFRSVRKFTAENKG